MLLKSLRYSLMISVNMTWNAFVRIIVKLLRNVCVFKYPVGSINRDCVSWQRMFTSVALRSKVCYNVLFSLQLLPRCCLLYRHCSSRGWFVVRRFIRETILRIFRQFTVGFHLIHCNFTTCLVTFAVFPMYTCNTTVANHAKMHSISIEYYWRVRNFLSVF